MLKALKTHKAKRFLVATLAVLMIFSATSVLATPSYNVSVIYTEFNSTSWTEHTFPNSANYTVSWSVDLTNRLTYNETTDSCSAKIRFQNGEDVSAGVIDLQYFEPTLGVGTVDIYASETDTGAKIGSMDYTTDEAITLAVSADGLTVTNDTGLQIEYNFLGFDIVNVSAQGGSVFEVTAGFFQLEFSDSSTDSIAILTEILPLMVTLAVLGMVFKMFDNLGKK